MKVELNIYIKIHTRSEILNPRSSNVEKSWIKTSLMRSKSRKTRLGDSPKNSPNIASL